MYVLSYFLYNSIILKYILFVDQIKLFSIYLQIKPNDNLPNNVCLPCLDDIKNAYSFKIKCEKADSILIENQTIVQTEEVKLYRIQIFEPVHNTNHIQY